MKLDETQKQKIRTWLDQGLKLGDIQNRIGAELGLKMTYMEVRFLLDDLKLQPKDPEPPKAPATDLKAKPAAEGSPAELAETEVVDEGIPALGNVSVSVDQIARPGAMVSGKVTFSDGKSAEWYLDQTGRLGVAPKEKGYKPSQEDVMAFQTELQNELAKMGF
jgi:hypothetical protein